MINSIIAKAVFNKLLKRPDISKAYKMVGPEDSWYNTIKTVHESLEKIQKLPHQSLEIKSFDGLALLGVFYPCKNAKGTVIFVHGYGSHAEREWAFPGLFYLSLGFNVLIPYQRAHGPSEGKRITLGALEHRDMLLWVEKINEITQCKNIVIHGLSMGGGIVLQLSDKPMTNVKCLISDAPSPSVEAFFANVSRDVFKKNGDQICDAALKNFKKQNSVDAKDFDGVEIVKRSKYPILLSAGSMENKEELFKTIRENNPSDTEIIILDGCNHGNGMYKQTEIYQSCIQSFISKYIQ